MAAAPATSYQPFTGERALSGAVELDLWNEHASHYRFARLFAHRKRVLDVRCSNGYGTQLLAESALHAIGFDLLPENISYASAHFPSAHFVCASPSDLPFPAASFDLLTAFQALEHPDKWECLISEAARVLAPDGILLVSASTQSYHASTRQEASPYFSPGDGSEGDLFQRSLCRRFPFVQVLAPASVGDDEAVLSSPAFLPATEQGLESRFLLAVCSKRPFAVPSFCSVSSASNILPDADTYIHLLQTELAAAQAQNSALLLAHQRVEHEASFQLKNHAIYSDALNSAIRGLLRERDFVRNSAWVRIGRTLGIGPWSSRSARLKALPRSVWNALSRRASFLFFYCLSPILLVLSALVLAAEDLCFLFVGKRHFPPETAPRNRAASIVIPNWNGCDLLRKFLPSLVGAVSAHPDNEIIIVDNASNDESVHFLQENFPHVRVLRNQENLGFAAAANHGVSAARNDIVVLLNNDMRVEPDFLAPLLEEFTDPLLFAVSSQIFLSDPAKPREETGLTEIWWQNGQLRVGHRIDPDLDVAYPCAYAGGGSSAFDRRKFLELGGFDSLFHPFYFEDTDLGLSAWKRGWKVLYQPASVVYHEHRGTIAKHFSHAYINNVVKKNSFLYCWKNIHDWKMLARHFAACLLSSLQTTSLDAARGFCRPVDTLRVFPALKHVTKSRWKALSRRKISDLEAFRRPQGGYYRDRFLIRNSPPPDRLNVLFAAPYPIEPPVHGGAVFMREALARLSSVANVHLVSFVDFKEQLPQQQALLPLCASAVFMARPYIPPEEGWTLVPFAIREFAIRDFAWAIHRVLYTRNIDVVQLEYTILGQYAGCFEHIPCVLFEHDIAFQAMWRSIRTGRSTGRVLREYLRMRIYEPKLLRRMARVQVCSRNSADYLGRLLPELKGRIDADVRAGIDVSRYNFTPHNRESDTLLFVGSFRHAPNRHALTWFVEQVLPIILQSRPNTSLIIVGSDPPQSGAPWMLHPNVRLLGSVPDVRHSLGRYCVFICPILSGSGVRVKLLEAFACGIPAVSTSIGAEGLASRSGDVCEIADTPVAFASSTVRLLQDEPCRSELAKRARAMVECERDSKAASVRLEALYRAEVDRMRCR